MASNLSNSINELSVGGNSNIDSESRACQIVHESKSTRIFRSNELGIKVFTDPNIINKALRLELQVSFYLPSSIKQRKALRVDTYQDLPALYFDWVEGVTAYEWLSNGSNETQPMQLGDAASADDPALTTRLNAAIAITEVICGFHECGVFHGNICLENIVLDFSGPSCSATLIDYSKSVILSDSLYSIRDQQERKDFTLAAKQKDLNDLGVVLYSIISNHPRRTDRCDVEVNSNDDANEQRNKKGKSQLIQTADNLPLYLVSLVSSLLTPVAEYVGHDQVQYKRPRQVLADLHLAISKPDIYLKIHRWADLVTKPLSIPHASFYGRRTELSMLQSSFDAMLKGGNKPCVFIAQGYAGSGKTSLIQQISKPLTESNGHMIVCKKFNQSDPPDTILASGFDSFFEQMLECDNNDAMINSIKEVFGERVAALEESMPHLQVLMGRSNTESSGDSVSQALKLRWKFQLSNLVYAISNQANPIALVFEDLQWAHTDALDTIQLILTDDKIRYCLFCMTYRDSGVQPKLTEMVDDLFKKEEVVLVWSVALGPVEKEAVDFLLSEALCMPPTVVQPLASVICSKTGGMILFITKFLKSLHDERLIYFNLTTLRWEFELEKIIHKEISTDIVDFLSERITRLPGPIQAGLKFASCLGSTFDLKVFQKANKSSDEVTTEFISFAKASGILQELSPNQFTWSHDQLYQAAYSLIPANLRESTHILVGMRIYLSAEDDAIMSMIHEIVRNMNIGANLIDEPDRKAELAHLNLVAGTQSKKTSAFYTASKYFMTGIDLLGDNWQDTNYYDLAMKLFNSATHMLLVTGEVDKFESTIKQPLTYAENFEDRLPAEHNYIRFLCSTSRYEEAIEKCFSILNEFGEKFPRIITQNIIQEEIVAAESMLTNFPKGELRYIPKLTGDMRHSLMKTMTYTLLIVMNVKREYMPLVGCRIASRSASYGWCSYGAFGLFAFGQALICLSNKIDAGHFWVKKSLALMKLLEDRENIPVLECLYHGHISFWKEPIQATCEEFIKINKDTMMEGQIEFAMSGSIHLVRRQLVCGINLVTINNHCTSSINEMAKFKQMQAIMYVVSQQSCILKLMGKDSDTIFDVFHGDINNEQELFDKGVSTGDEMIVGCINFSNLFVSYWLQNYDAAIQAAEQYTDSNGAKLYDIYYILYQGLTALHLARKESHGREKWISIGESAVSKFQTWESHSNWNFENKHLLLSAELSSVKGDFNVAEEKYKASIVSAQKHRFLHEEGLAMELLGLFYKNQGDLKSSKDLLTKARECYINWGATAVVERLFTSP